MAETEFKYDVFISYTSANKEWVRKTFVPTLEKAGLKCCDYYRDFDVGAPIVKEMERAVLESRKTILVLSPAYLKSGWTEFENLMLQTLDAANQEHRLLPVIYEKCELPLRFRYMNCANFDHPDDVEVEWQRLFKALGSTGEAHPKISDGSRESWHLAHPYPMPPNFTGRATELKMLDDWLADDKDRLFILRALGGFGKSAFAWQWINTHLDPTEWTKLVWWSFYEGDASFEHFVEETLKYLKLEIPQGGRPQVDALLKAMQSQKILLIMDGFERTLRAYSSMNAAYQGDEEPKLEDNQLDCVNINAEIFLKNVCSLPNMKSKVLMTTRLTPRAVKPRGEFMVSCREEELTAMQKGDAVEFFHKQKIKGTHAEIEASCEPYGYHPLSLRILSGWIVNDRSIPGDIAAAKNLEITKDIIQNKHHILEVGFNSLSPSQKKLLGRFACFRTSMTYNALKTLHGDGKGNVVLDESLKLLESVGLLHWDRKANKYDLHPIVRRFAYDRLTAADRTGAHVRLVNYFEAVPKPEKARKQEDLAPVIELYHHMVRAGKLDEARNLFRERLSPNPLYFQFGAYPLITELLLALFIDGEDKPPRLKDEGAQAWTCNELANAYSLSGQPRRAVPLNLRNVAYDEEHGRKKHLAIGLGNLALRQSVIGALREAEHNLHRQIGMRSDVNDNHIEAVAHAELGRVLVYRGLWNEADDEFGTAIKIFDSVRDIQYIGIVWSYRALRFLLVARDNPRSSIENRKLAIASALRALELAEEAARQSYPTPRDYIRAYWLLGAAHRAHGVWIESTTELAKAEENLSKVINICRGNNTVEAEAEILLDLARLRYDQKNYGEAKSLAEEALSITERCGYVLQGADVNLFLAKYALEQEKDKVKAKEYAESALKLAYCDGPPYYYKVAYEEAERLLKKLG
jgi:tetratricopeptide (TPR) repeat protein